MVILAAPDHQNSHSKISTSHEVLAILIFLSEQPHTIHHPNKKKCLKQSDEPVDRPPLSFQACFFFFVCYKRETAQFPVLAESHMGLPGCFPECITRTGQ